MGDAAVAIDVLDLTVRKMPHLLTSPSAMVTSSLRRTPPDVDSRYVGSAALPTGNTSDRDSNEDLVARRPLSSTKEGFDDPQMQTRDDVGDKTDDENDVIKKCNYQPRPNKSPVLDTRIHRSPNKKTALTTSNALAGDRRRLKSAFRVSSDAADRPSSLSVALTQRMPTPNVPLPSSFYGQPLSPNAVAAAAAAAAASLPFNLNRLLVLQQLYAAGGGGGLPASMIPSGVGSTLYGGSYSSSGTSHGVVSDSVKSAVSSLCSSSSPSSTTTVADSCWPRPFVGPDTVVSTPPPYRKRKRASTIADDDVDQERETLTAVERATAGGYMSGSENDIDDDDDDDSNTSLTSSNVRSFSGDYRQGCGTYERQTAPTSVTSSPTTSMFAQRQTPISWPEAHGDGSLSADANGAGISSRSMTSSVTAVDPSYVERRRKNNEAAKRSRDARRNKERETAARAATLEQENMRLKAELAVLKTEAAKLQSLLFSRF